MDNLEMIIEYLEKSKDESREVVSRNVEVILLENYKKIKKCKSEFEEKLHEDKAWLIPIDILIDLSKKYNFPISKSILDFYHDESYEFINLEEGSSPASNSGNIPTLPDDDLKTDEGLEIHVPKEYTEAELTFEEDRFFDVDFEEDSMESGKEFDDYCVGDEDWVEPQYESEDFIAPAIYYDRNEFRPNSLQFQYP